MSPENVANAVEFVAISAVAILMFRYGAYIIAGSLRKNDWIYLAGGIIAAVSIISALAYIMNPAVVWVTMSLALLFGATISLLLKR